MIPSRVLALLATTATLSSASPDLPLLGKIKARSAKEISSSSWSVGGETLDRDYATYDAYKPYLGALGAKGLRLQAGWAKCEKSPGIYDFAWLDAIVDDALSQHVQPWMQLSYGNPIYPGGGDAGLGGGFPNSPEAHAAWDAWVRATVVHYRGRIHEWEVWNEPDLNTNDAALVGDYSALYIRTASIIREIDPGAKIYALALCHDVNYAKDFLTIMKQAGKFQLIDAITIHTYPNNPDEVSNISQLRKLTLAAGKSIPIRQGETGANSKYQNEFALKKTSWSENTQAKWNLRRMLAHHAIDVPFNLFTMADLHYKQNAELEMNYKGLLATRPDQSIDHIKLAYAAAQSVFSIFDDTLQLIDDFPFTTTALRQVALSGYRRQPGGAQVVALWFDDAPPSEANGTSPVDVTLPNGHFREPVWVDLLTSEVHEIPRERWTSNERGDTFKALPVYDSPILIAERNAIVITTP